MHLVPLIGCSLGSLQAGGNAPQSLLPLAMSKAIELLKELVGKILDEIVPSTDITVKHQNIKLETEKASIEIDGANIKIEAEGDITLSADGKIKIEGSAVSISPKPTTE
jgi:hypothetical protein